jgi:hypothetical protein
LRIIKDCPTWTPQILRTSNTEETSGDDMGIWVRSQNPDFSAEARDNHIQS